MSRAPSVPALPGPNVARKVPGGRKTGAELARAGRSSEDAVGRSIGLNPNRGKGRFEFEGASGSKRIPDFNPDVTLKKYGAVVEVKSGKSNLGWFKQLDDLSKYARSEGGILVIYTNRSVVGELKRRVGRGDVVILPIPKRGQR